MAVPATPPPAARVRLRGLPLLIDKLRAGGLAWLRERLREEWRMPRTAAGQALFRATRSAGRAVGLAPRLRVTAGTVPSDILYAFYDLGVAPITFDFLWFLVGAELERRRCGLSSVHAVIVPGPRDGLRKENPELERSLDIATRRARIVNVLQPACALLPTLSGVTLASSRAAADRLVQEAGGAVFPARYEPALPRYPGPQEPLRAARRGEEVAVLRANPADLRAVDGWLAAHGCDRPVVTITLRGYNYVSGRNSNVAAWAAFARQLEDGGRFAAVIVPDTEQVYSGIPTELQGLRICCEAAVTLGLRMALYERAHLNLGVNNGPMGLCWLNARTRYITFKLLSDAAPHTSAEYMKFLGFEIGRSLPCATEWQRWVWADDDLPVIRDAFEDMIARLDAAQPVPSSSAA